MSSVMGYLEAVYSRKYFRSVFILLPQGKFISQQKKNPNVHH